MQPRELAVLLGANIRHRRKELRLTQEELAARLEITQSYLSEVENGKRSPLVGRLASFAEALEVSPSYLLAGAALVPISENAANCP